MLLSQVSRNWSLLVARSSLPANLPLRIVPRERRALDPPGQVPAMLPEVPIHVPPAATLVEAGDETPAEETRVERGVGRRNQPLTHGLPLESTP